MKFLTTIFVFILIIGCGKKEATIKPVNGAITESVYASGIIKSLNQYQAFSSGSGVISAVYVAEGDLVKAGDPILSVSNTVQRLNRENAELAMAYSDVEANKSRLNDALNQARVSDEKRELDSMLYVKQQLLWKQQVGTETDLNQKALNFENAKAASYAAHVKYNELKRQVKFNASQAKNSLQLSASVEGDFTLHSDINGRIYQLNRKKGEVIGPQVAVALVGDDKRFILEMQVDENDIVKVRTGMEVLAVFDSYPNQVFNAVVQRINPMLNERTKTFVVEGSFVVQPPTLFPGMSFEASIVLNKKEQTLLIPRNCLYRDSLVITSSHDTLKVATGLMDYRMVEILSGIPAQVELIQPIE